jgi:hypothetical protein
MKPFTYDSENERLASLTWRKLSVTEAQNESGLPDDEIAESAGPHWQLTTDTENFPYGFRDYCSGW